MSLPSHYIPLFLLATIFFLVSGGCAVSPFHDFEFEDPSTSTEVPDHVDKKEYDYIPLEQDRPRILCGQALIHTLKEQCGQRGTFSPYHKRSAWELIRVARSLPGKLETRKFIQPTSSLDAFSAADVPRRIRKRHDDICEVYLKYEPESPLSQCCCLGCTRAYLENFCAEA